MAKGKRTKKQNYIFRDPIIVFILVLIFFCTLFKVIYLKKTCELVGLGLYTTCFTIYTLITSVFFVTFYSVSKKTVISKKSRGQIRNALQWIKVSSCGAFFAGLFFMLLLLLFKGYLGKLLNISALGNLIFIFLAIALPVFFFNGVMAGGFSGFGFYMPLYSGIVMFIVGDCLFGFLFSTLIGKAGNINSALFHNHYINTAFYGAGMAFGFLLGNIIPAVWQMILLKVFGNSIKNGTIEQYGKNSESVSEQLRSFIVFSGYPLLINILNVLPFLICLFFSFKFTSVTEFANEGNMISLLGICSVQMLLLFFIPLYFARLLAKHSEDLLNKSMAKQDRYHGGMRMLFSFKQFLCFVLPIICFVGLCAADLSQIILGFHIPDITLFLILCIALIAFSGLLHAFLRGFDKNSMVICNKVIGLLSEIVYLFVVLKPNVTVQHILIAYLVYYGVVCIADIICLYRYFVYKKQLLRHLVFPILAFAAFVLVSFLSLYLKNSIGILLSICVSFLLALFVHSIILILTGTIKEHELPEYPQSPILLFLGKIVGVY